MFYERIPTPKSVPRIVRVQKKMDYSSKPRSSDVRRLKRIMAHRTIPFPLEKIRRQVLLNLHVIDKQVERFQTDHLRPADVQTNGQLDDFLDSLLGKITPASKVGGAGGVTGNIPIKAGHTGPTPVKGTTSATGNTGVTPRGTVTVSQCREILESHRFSRIHTRPEYSITNKLVQTHSSFQSLAQLAHKLILQSYNEGLRRYCVSFFAEAQGQELDSVQNYETSIQERSSAVETVLKRLDGIVTTQEKLARDIRGYVREYEKVQTIMSEFCDVIKQLEEPLKEWVFADREYVPQLLEESERLRQELEKIRRGNKMKEHDWSLLEKRLQRRSWQRQNLEAEIREEKYKLKTQRQRQKSLQAHLEHTQTLLECRLTELGHCKEKQHRKKANFNQEEFERLSRDVDDLTDKIRHVQTQLRELHEDDIRLKKSMHTSRDELTKMAGEEKMMKQKLETITENKDDLQERQNNLDARIQALKRIRFIKLHPDTVRKIRLYGYLPHSAVDAMRYSTNSRRSPRGREALERAFRTVGESLGRQWPQLYMKLPFEPQRDAQSRKQDLKAIASQTESVSHEVSEGAVRALERWYSLSYCASLTQLLTTLTRINRNDVVKRVNKTAVTS